VHTVVLMIHPQYILLASCTLPMYMPVINLF